MPVYRTQCFHSSTPFYSRITGYIDLIAEHGKIELSDLGPENNAYRFDRHLSDDSSSSKWIATKDVLLVRAGKPLLAVFVSHRPGYRPGSGFGPLGGYVDAHAHGGMLAGSPMHDVANSITAAMEGLPDIEKAKPAPVDETEYHEAEWRILVRIPGQPNKLFKGGPFDIATLEEAFVFISQQIVAAVGSAPAP